LDDIEIRKKYITLLRDNDFVCFPLPKKTKKADYRFKGAKTEPNQIIKDDENYGVIPILGAVTASRVRHGLLISSNGFSGDACEEANKKTKKIFLIDKEVLSEEIVQNTIGLVLISLGVIKNVDAEWWQEIKSK